MKIRIIRGVVADKATRSEGEELVVADREGRQLIAQGKAVEVLQIKAKVETVELKAEEPKPVVKKKITKRRKLID